MRNLASIQEITEIRPIEGADRIVVATVLGWHCVVKKDEFQVGDKVVYIEVDSIVPDIPAFDFLKGHFRIKTIKLRKQVSQGLVMPLSILPKKNWKVGDDVTDVLGVKKYENPQERAEREKAEIEASRIKRFLSKNKWFKRLFSKPSRRGWPKFITKTDETRVQNFPNICKEQAGVPFFVTEKLDGCSATYFIVQEKKGLFGRNKYRFGVCSRNLHLPKNDGSHYWKIAEQYDIEKVLVTLAEAWGKPKYLVVQGEIVGEGIQGNKLKVQGLDFYAFNLFDETQQVDQFRMDTVLALLGVKSVPVLKPQLVISDKLEINDDMFYLPETLDELVEYSKGKSVLAPDVHREGVVIRNYHKNISFKVINPDFLLKFDSD